MIDALQASGRQDRLAFDLVYRQSAQKLFGVCLNICGQRQAAEDVLQEVFAIIWRRADSYDAERASPIAWMSAIARNRAIDWRRSRGSRIDEELSAADDVADPARSVVDILLRAEADHQVVEELDRLNPRQAQAIRRTFLEGLTQAQLAAACDLPVGTIKSNIRRGLLRLRERLTGVEPSGDSPCTVS